MNRYMTLVLAGVLILSSSCEDTKTEDSKEETKDTDQPTVTDDMEPVDSIPVPEVIVENDTPEIEVPDKTGIAILDNESLGGIIYGMSQETVTAILGEADKVVDDGYNEHIDYHFVHWIYPDLGLTVKFAKDSQNPEFKAFLMTAIVPCNLATAKGIKIGDDFSKINEAYSSEIAEYKQQNTTLLRQNVPKDGGLFFGDVDGLTFSFENNLVTEINLGVILVN